MNKKSKEEFYLDIAKTVSQRSTCMNIKTGCVIVNREFDTIVSIGYNSAPIGCDDCEDNGECNVLKYNDSGCCIGTSSIANALIFMPSYEKYCDIFIYSENMHTNKEIYFKPTFEHIKMLLNGSIFRVHISHPEENYISFTTDELYYDAINDMVVA